MTKEYENRHFEDQAVCPYCDYRHSPELVNWQQSRWCDCGKCGERFLIEFHFEVSYTTIAADDPWFKGERTQ